MNPHIFWIESDEMCSQNSLKHVFSDENILKSNNKKILHMQPWSWHPTFADKESPKFSLLLHVPYPFTQT